jgi:uncharacterized membrane protein (DUF106 family)
MNAEHCLAIAAAFIAIVAACANLISVANNKSDTLANRYRELTKEFREGAAKENRTMSDDKRLKQLQEQIDLYALRVDKVVQAQCLLFRTISILIASIVIFIGIGLGIVFFNLSEEKLYQNAPVLLWIFGAVIGVGVVVGAVYMFRAITRLYKEVREAAQTFRIETDDCLSLKARKNMEGLSSWVNVPEQRVNPIMPD